MVLSRMSDRARPLGTASSSAPGTAVAVQLGAGISSSALSLAPPANATGTTSATSATNATSTPRSATAPAAPAVAEIYHDIRTPAATRPPTLQELFVQTCIRNDLTAQDRQKYVE